jgi:hypothetical protein
MSIDRGAIDEQLRAIGENAAWWEHRDFRMLPEILHPEERILGLSRGVLARWPVPRLLPTGKWLIVVTSERLICLRQERFGRKQLELRLDQVTAMTHRTGLRGARVALYTPLQRCRLRLSRADAFRMIGILAPFVARQQLELSRTGADVIRLPSPSRGLTTLPILGWLSGARDYAPDGVTREQMIRVEATVDRLEKEVERLQQQVDFLENLLVSRGEMMLAAADPGSEP